MGAGAGRERRAVPRRAGIVRPRAARTEACECGKRGRPSRLRPGSDGPHGVPGRRPRAEPHQKGRGHMSPFVRPVRRAPHPEADLASPAEDGLRPLEEAKKVGPRDARELSKTFFGRMAVNGYTAGRWTAPSIPTTRITGPSRTSSVPPPPQSKAWRPPRPPAGHRRPRPTRPVPAADAVRQEMTQSKTGDALGVSQTHVSRLPNRLWRACAAASTRATPNPCGLRKRGCADDDWCRTTGTSGCAGRRRWPRRNGRNAPRGRRPGRPPPAPRSKSGRHG